MDQVTTASSLRPAALQVGWLPRVLGLGLGVLALAVSARVRIPLPWTPVPVTLQDLVALLCGALLGVRLGVGATAAYLGLGAAGLPVFASGEDLVHKTPAFYESAIKRLDFQLARSYELVRRHFGGDNPYLEEMGKNVRYAERVASSPEAELRRQPPSTLAES